MTRTHVERTFPSWSVTYPELATRQLFVAEMVQNKRLRHVFFRGLNLLENIVAMPDPAVRKHLFALVSAQVLDELVVTWPDPVPRGSGLHIADLNEKGRAQLLVFNQMIGALRNILHNMRAGLLERDVKPLNGRYEVHVVRLGRVRPITKAMRRAWAHADCGDVCQHGDDDCPNAA